jgi:predicted RND superfamily exporter protein
MPKDSISEYYNKFKLLQNNLLQIDGVEACHSSLGVVQAISVLNLHKFSEEAIFKRIIKGKAKSENKGMLNYFISPNKDRFRLIVKTKYINNQQLAGLLPKIEQKANTVFKQINTPHYITGTAVLFGILSNDLLQSQILSLIFSFLIVLLVFMIVFRKAKYFISGILPNILPVISSIGIMGFLGIHMDVGTILIASISLGVAVDDTVYLLISFKNSVSKYPHKNSIKRSFNEVWQPLVITTLILSLGFLLLVFSSYTPIIYLGLFVSLNFVFALIYDFLLLPALLILFKID